MLTAENIHFSFETMPQLINGIDFSIKSGEIISIVGASGVGKSTLLKCLAGLHDISKGQISLDGNVISSPNKALIAGHDDIGIVSQSFSEDPYFTVTENINRKLLNLTNNDRESFTNELLELFQLKSLSNIKSHLISGGEKQRLSMACALAQEPKVLLLDEPFAHLDVHLRKRVGRFIKKQCNKYGLAVVLVTHEGSEALSWSDFICFMQKGRLLNKQTPEKAYYKPRSLKQGLYFGELNSFRKKDKQILFRPNEYDLKGKEADLIELEFNEAEFRGGYYANYFKLVNGREVVLYSANIMREIKKIYVKK